jgi:CRISPR-associated protein Csm1
MSEKTDFNRIFEENNCCIKGDISGIQDFIFNVKSKSAARVLRARSFHVYALAEIALELFREKLGANNVHVMYNGGGNFYFFSKDVSDATFETIRAEIDSAFAKEDLQLVVSKVAYEKDSDFGIIWKKINLQSARDKMRRFWSTPEVFDKIRAFDPRQKETDLTDDYRNFASKLGRDKITGFVIGPGQGNKKVSATHINLLGKSFTLTGQNNLLLGNIIAQVPTYGDHLSEGYKLVLDNMISSDGDEDDEKLSPGDVLTFGALGAFAKYRTGTDKLGVLKLDVDSLGNKFNSLQNASEAHSLSSLLNSFFTVELTKIWQKSFVTLIDQGKGKPAEKHEAKFSDNVSVIFAGGDDCMAVGAWDAIFEFTKAVKTEFDVQITAKYPEITFSAGLIMLDSKFPVVRFADMADTAMAEAKKVKKDKKGGEKKTSYVSFLNEVLTWEEFVKCSSVADKVRKLIIEKDEPRSVLERIARSAIGFSKIQDKAMEGTLRNRQVWKLFYYIRQSKNREEIMSEIINDYEKSLLATITNKNMTNPRVFPLAARWAEFLTRKKQNNER